VVQVKALVWRIIMAREVAVVVVQVQIPVPCMTMIHAGEEVVQVLVRAKGLALD
jgi:hypothetical protein